MKNSNKNLSDKAKKEKRKEVNKKEKILEFIENNSPKSDFLHWVMNNTEKKAFSEEDSWLKIKKELQKNSDFTSSILRDYAVTLETDKDVQDVLKEVAKTTKEAEKTANRLTFLGRFKKFSVAIGGIIVFLALVKIFFTIVLIFSLFQVFPNINSTLRLIITIFLAASGLVELIGGIFLIET